jgi:hypothetical protein
VKRVWYVAYGSNLSLARFRCYLRGGRPSGSGREYPGCRDNSDPTDDLALMIKGEVYFAGRSSAWRAGMAFYDPDANGRVPVRAYLISADQFVDVLAQETRCAPGMLLDLAPAFRGDRFSSGLGGYPIVVRVGDRDGVPMLCFTRDRRDAELNPPSAAYLDAMAAGLREAHGWSTDRIDRYLENLPGGGRTPGPEPALDDQLDPSSAPAARTY